MAGSVSVKVCGINDPASLHAAVAGGARRVGFVFYPPSPRALSLGAAAALASRVPAGIDRVAVLVDVDDDTLAQILARVPLEALQLHGRETPERVAGIRARTGLEAIKAVPVAGAADIAAARAFLGAADRMLFDGKAPKGAGLGLPGGNGLAFDWRRMARAAWPGPWILSGGLDPGNLAEAVAASGARAVDVSSGVEDRPGVKSPAKIRAFLAAAAEAGAPGGGPGDIREATGR